MELRAFATALIDARTVDDKLRPPPTADPLTDDDPGPPTRRTRPERPDALTIVHPREVRVPKLEGMRDPAQRARILHAFANHELQAAELFAWAVLAFPDAPAAFRKGLVGILADEQRHCRMYLERLAAHGGSFGDYRVTGHFWSKAEGLRTPLDFVCTMGLTFECANLDFALEYSDAARAAGDHATAAVIDKVHDDEIRHVKFGWHWLRELKPESDSMWDTYLAHLQWPLDPGRARGKRFDREARIAAGFDDDFIARLEATRPKQPSGKPSR